MSKISLKILVEEMKFMADIPYTVSSYLKKKWEKDPTGLEYFFGEPELIKKWRLNPTFGTRSLPKSKEEVDQMLADNPSQPGQSGKNTRKEIYQFWLEKLTGTSDPDEIEFEDKQRVHAKAKSEVYNRIWRDISPDVILHKLTIPDDNLRRLFNFIKANLQDPDEGDPRPPKLGTNNYDEKKDKYDKFIEDMNNFQRKMKEASPSSRARYLFNIILQASGGMKKPKKKGPGERAPLGVAVERDPNAKYADPFVHGRTPKKGTGIKRYKLGKPYVSKRKRGKDD